MVVAAALVGAMRRDKQEEVTVGLIVKRNTNPFWVTMKDTAEATADDDDVKLLTAAGKSDIDNDEPGRGVGEDDREGRQGHHDHPGRLDGDRARDREGTPRPA